MKKIFFILIISFTIALWSEEFLYPSYRNLSSEEIYNLNNREIQSDKNGKLVSADYFYHTKKQILLLEKNACRY